MIVHGKELHGIQLGYKKDLNTRNKKLKKYIIKAIINKRLQKRMIYNEKVKLFKFCLA